MFYAAFVDGGSNPPGSTATLMWQGRVSSTLMPVYCIRPKAYAKQPLNWQLPGREDPKNPQSRKHKILVR